MEKYNLLYEISTFHQNNRFDFKSSAEKNDCISFIAQTTIDLINEFQISKENNCEYISTNFGSDYRIGNKNDLEDYLQSVVAHPEQFDGNLQLALRSIDAILSWNKTKVDSDKLLSILGKLHSFSSN